MKKSLFMILLVSVFISCNSLNEDISNIESNSSDNIELNQSSFMDPTQIWGDPDGGSSGGGSGTHTKWINGDCDSGNFVYFIDDIFGRLKVSGEYFRESDKIKVKNLNVIKIHVDADFIVTILSKGSTTIGSTSSSISVNYNYKDYFLIAPNENYTFENESFTINPCQQTIY